MDSTVILSIIISLISGGLVGFLTAYINLKNSERRIQVEIITQERKKWREYMREWLDHICSIEIDRLSDQEKNQIRSTLVARINLNDKFDKDILENLDKILNLRKIDVETKAKELICILQIQISALLKHDWERTKNEINRSLFNKKTTDELNLIRKKVLSKIELKVVDDMDNTAAGDLNVSDEFYKFILNQATLVPLFFLSILTTIFIYKRFEIYLFGLIIILGYALIVSYVVKFFDKTSGTVFLGLSGVATIAFFLWYACVCSSTDVLVFIGFYEFSVVLFLFATNLSLLGVYLYGSLYSTSKLVIHKSKVPIGIYILIALVIYGSVIATIIQGFNTVTFNDPINQVVQEKFK